MEIRDLNIFNFQFLNFPTCRFFAGGWWVVGGPEFHGQKFKNENQKIIFWGGGVGWVDGWSPAIPRNATFFDFDSKT